jgi:hypothetical protein
MDVDAGPYWTRAPQSIIDHHIVESLRGFHPHVAPPGLIAATIWLVLLDPISWNLCGDSTLILSLAGHQQLRYNTSVDMRKEADAADFSVPFQILWLTIIYGARITGDTSY